MTLRELLDKAPERILKGTHEFFKDKQGVSHLVIFTRVSRGSGVRVDFLIPCDFEEEASRLYDGPNILDYNGKGLLDYEIAPFLTCITCAKAHGDGRVER